MHKAIVYIRVSTEEQVTNNSLENQKAACMDFLAKNDWGLAKIFREEGESAKTANRTQFLKAIEYAKQNKGKIDYFVVYKVDRFARNNADHAFVKALLKGYGISLRSVTEPIDDSPTGNLMDTMLSGFAQFDNEVKAERSKNGMRASFEKGYWFWNTPPGLVRSKDAFGKPIIKRAENYTNIQYLLKKFAKGGLTQTEFRKEALKLGITTQTNLLSPQRVSDMLRNPLYAGIQKSSLSEKIVRKDYGLITEEEHEQIIKILEGRNRLGQYRKRENPDFPLKHILTCADCSQPLRGSSSKGRSKYYSYYHCTNCKKSITSQSALHEDFEELLKRVIPSANYLNLYKEVFIRHWNNETGQIMEHRKGLDRQIDELSKRRQTVIDLQIDGKITPEIAAEQIDMLETDIANMRLKRTSVQEAQYDAEAVVSYALNFINNLPKLWRDSSIEDKIRFQNAVFPDGLEYKFGNGFGTVNLGPCLSYILKTDVKKSTLVRPAGVEPTTFSTAN